MHDVIPHFGDVHIAQCPHEEASLDGSLRLLRLSVQDRVQYLDGRKVRQVQRGPRWRDDFQSPGQSIALRFCPGPGRADVEGCSSACTVRFVLASSPTSARNDSAGLDATLVDILLDAGEADEAATLASQTPGAVLEVSQVLGRGFSSLLTPGADLGTALEEGRPLLLLGAGARGVAALRAALSWTPLMAHAQEHAVVAAVVAPAPPAAPFLVEWQAWRDAGVAVHPLYRNGEASGAGAGAAEESTLCQALDGLLGAGAPGLRALLGPGARDACVLLSGVAAADGAELGRRLAASGIHSHRILVADAGAVGLGVQ